MVVSDGKESFRKVPPRIKFGLVVEDAKVENAVNTILRQAQPQSQEEGGKSLS